MNKIILSYDKSNEDIPTLVVGREEGYSLLGGQSLRIDKVITGQKAEDIWEELTGQKAFKAKVNEMMNAYNEEMDKLEKEEI